ncbi:DUF4402 domain-containing protein [Christiangramia aquimixticola]|uniref:DUF4402 domain-containing protein n=1 Tax=Christiangramia aquimixticola TaxID=1697558 RepID=UPI003AA7E7D9
MPLINYGQSSATATFTATVNIIQPIQITTTSHMNFADVDAQSGGEVVLNPDNSRITKGGVLLQNSENASAASFMITGQSDLSFAVEIPSDEYKMTNGNDEIIIKDFSTNIKTKDIKKGVQIIRVGATLELQPNQEPGKYTNAAPLAVTVSYN